MDRPYLGRDRSGACASGRSAGGLVWDRLLPGTLSVCCFFCDVCIVKKKLETVLCSYQNCGRID